MLVDDGRRAPRGGRSRSGRAIAAASCFCGVLILGATSSPAHAASLPPGFVRLADVAPLIRQDMRYAGSDNFLGRRAAGYEAGECWLLRPVAEALGRVAEALARDGWRLVVYDCYRPARAVADFMAWADDLRDQSTKAAHYPALDKRSLVAGGYIARVSGHSTGGAVDAGAEARDGSAVDFGTPFDFFDPRSAGQSRAVPAEAAENRRRLRRAFMAEGFAPLKGEWWHFSHTAAAGAKRYDAPIDPAAR